MVYFFTCSDPKYTIYMGEDKFENEELIKFAFPEGMLLLLFFLTWNNFIFFLFLMII